MKRRTFLRVVFWICDSRARACGDEENGWNACLIEDEFHFNSIQSDDDDDDAFRGCGRRVGVKPSLFSSARRRRRFRRFRRRRDRRADEDAAKRTRV